MKVGVAMRTGRIAPIRRGLLASIAPEPLKRQQWSEVQLRAGWVKWLDDHGHPAPQIARVLDLDRQFVRHVTALLTYRKVPAIKPPPDVLERFA